MKAKFRIIQSIVILGVWIMSIFAVPASHVSAAPASHPVISSSLSAGSSDTDQDGLTNAQEKVCGTNPKVADSNKNGIKDGADDQDHDGLSNKAEFEHGTKCRSKDSDHDGVSDGQEVSHATDPLKKDDKGSGASDTSSKGSDDKSNH